MDQVRWNIIRLAGLYGCPVLERAVALKIGAYSIQNLAGEGWNLLDPIDKR
jgi:hypothetical protein